MVSLEAIDLAAPEPEIVTKMMDQMSKVGFCYVKNVPNWNE